MASKLSLTPAQRTIIDCANRLYEELEYEDVNIVDVYASTDLEFEQIHEAIDTCPVLEADHKTGNIVRCPDSDMLKYEYGL